MIYKKLWSSSDAITYFNKSTSWLRKQRLDGLPCIMLSGAYFYYYNDLMEFLK